MANPQTRNFLGRHSSKLALGALGLGGLYMYQASRPPKPAGAPADTNLLRTPAVKNIEGAYQNGGATSTHTKAYGGTPLGVKSDVMRDDAGTGKPLG
jgi:hypothetical protein